MKWFVRLISAAIGVASAILGIGVSYTCYYYYSQELKNPFYFAPVWKTTLILTLLIAAIVFPLFAAYRFLKFAISQKE